MTDSWIQGTEAFQAPVPYLLRTVKDPEAPLVVVCHGMGETPETARASWNRVLALEVHAFLPAGPYPFERRTRDALSLGHAWYLYDGGDVLFRESATRARDWLLATLERAETAHGLRPRARAVAGYSQGGYFGAFVALSRQDRFDRLVMVAGRIKESFVAPYLDRPGTFHTLILHGATDAQVLPDAAERSRDVLVRAGYPVELEFLPRGHRLHPDRDVRAAALLERAWFPPRPSHTS